MDFIGRWLKKLSTETAAPAVGQDCSTIREAYLRRGVFQANGFPTSQ